MKLKLLTLGILAALLCAMIPMATTAAPVVSKETTIKGKLYQSVWEGQLFPQGKNFGKVVIDTQAKTWTVTANKNAKFTPGQHELVVAEEAPPSIGGLVIGYVTADENGYIVSASGDIAPGWSIQNINDALANGGWFFVEENQCSTC